MLKILSVLKLSLDLGAILLKMLTTALMIYRQHKNNINQGQGLAMA